MRRRWQWAVIAGLALIALSYNIQNERLRQKLNSQIADATLPRNARLQPMNLSRLDELGAPNDLTQGLESFESDQEQLVFVFSPTCRYSGQALDDWAALRVQAEHRFRIVAITIGSGEENALLNREFGGIARIAVDYEQIKANKMLSTPQVLWLSSDGRVKASWAGAQALLPRNEDFTRGQSNE